MSKKAASEDMIGKLHFKVTKIFGMALDQMIEKLELGEVAEFAADPKLLALVVKFINDNKIFAIPNEEVKDDPLAVKLAAIKARANVVPLVANRD